MIPRQIDDAAASSAERRLFALLESDPNTKDWTVLHSLGIARRAAGPFGEIDFVVIIPGEGIICLEVKGGRVSCDAGIWHTMDRYGKVAALRKSPFMQSRESMFALRNSIVNHFGDRTAESKCPIGCGVVFPDVRCPPITPEFERSDVIDFEDLRRPISLSIARIARARLRKFQPQSPSCVLPTHHQAKAIRDFLRPDFELVVAKSVSIGRTEEKLLKLTREQYARLDELERNSRCLFEGAAGTGKTLLALEYARRAANNGSKVLLVCFNRLLGNWLQRQSEGSGVTAGSLHEIARRLILASGVAEEFLEQECQANQSGNLGELFAQVYPFYGALALEEMGPRFDVLVIDEMQDLCNLQNLDFVNLAIIGGLAGGRWAIFGDFTRQALYNHTVDPDAILEEYCEHFVRARLTLNCRNTRRIAEETTIVAGFETPPFTPAKELGLPVEHWYWKTTTELVRSLSRVIDQLVTEGTQIENITVISTHRLENSALAGTEKIGRFPLVDVSRDINTMQRSIKFSTIHSFKGLESQVIVIVDIDKVDGQEAQSLLYVGMSRARSLLILMINERARKSMDDRIRTAMSQEIKP